MTSEIFKELDKLTHYLKINEKDKVLGALKISKNAYSNQLRKSGDPFIIHPLEGKNTYFNKVDGDSIVAGLLHDTVEDTDLIIEDINKKFGNKISQLVQGLTKISNFSLKAKNQKYGENYKMLILATTEDLRVILIKLADRLHNMRTIKFIKDLNKST